MTQQVLKQAADVHLQTMQMFQALGAALTGGFTAIRDSSSRPAPALMPAPPLMPSHGRHAICDAPSFSKSIARGGGEAKVSEVGHLAGGTVVDQVNRLLADVGVQIEGSAAMCILAILGQTPFSEHHQTLIRCIAMHSTDESTVALFFMLFTASAQFRAWSFQSFRDECTDLLVSNRASTLAIFSSVCSEIIKVTPTWSIKKGGEVKVMNAVLKDPRQHHLAFDALVKLFTPSSA
jgi:hypothetical protein